MDAGNCILKPYTRKKRAFLFAHTVKKYIMKKSLIFLAEILYFSVIAMPLACIVICSIYLLFGIRDTFKKIFK